MLTVYWLANTKRICYCPSVDEGRKRVIGIMAAILASLHMQHADDLVSRRTERLAQCRSDEFDDIRDQHQQSRLRSHPAPRKREKYRHGDRPQLGDSTPIVGRGASTCQ
jgi:hypothetical protein